VGSASNAAIETVLKFTAPVITPNPANNPSVTLPTITDVLFFTSTTPKN
jgi:hypothetical protein